MPTEYHIGPGQTYDAANAWDTVRALIPTDFSGESDHHDVIFHAGYSYTSTPTLLNIVNTTASKTLRIRCADGDEHLGDFSQGVELLFVPGNNYWFYINCDYLQISNLRTKDQAGGNGHYLIRMNSGQSPVFENIIGEVIRTGNFDAWMFYLNGNSVTDILINNCIQWNNGALFTKVWLLGSVGSSKTGKMNNCIAYDCDIGAYLDNATWEVNNFGALASSDSTTRSRLTLTSGTTGRNCYTNGSTTNVVGVSKIVDTLANLKFIDPTNGDFRMKLDSQLAQSGYNATADNPETIDLQPVSIMSRPPFNGIMLQDKLLTMPPLQRNKIYDSFISGLVIADTFEWEGPNFGTMKTLARGSGFEQGYSTFGPYINNYNSSDSRTYSTKTFDKYLTHFQVMKRISGNPSLLRKNFGSSPFILETNFSTGRIEFTLDTFTGYNDISTDIDYTKHFGVLIEIDLTKSTDAERVGLYLWQKGKFFPRRSFTCTGTAPTSMSSFLDQLAHTTCNAAECSSLYVWDRILNTFEIQNLMFDPYKPYRDPRRTIFFRVNDIIKSSGLWFLRKFIMEK